MDQEVPGSVGRVSLTDTPWATPAPLLVTVMVNPMGSPADTVWLSATLAMSMAAPRTTMESDALSDPSLEVVTLAVLSTGELPAVAEVVGEEMCTVSTAPEAMSPKEQDRTPAEMEQLPAPVPPSMDQEVPGSVGSGSLTVTPWATPAPLLVTVMVNPMVSPAETGELSATLAMSMAAPRTTMESDALSDPSLEVVTLAVLSTGELPAVAEVVGEEMCTVSTAPEAMSPKEQDRTPAEMEQLPAPVPPSMDQEVRGSVGSGSLTDTPLATPAPLLVTVMVNPMVSPAETGELSATLAMSMAAQFTVLGTGPTGADPSLDVVTAAEVLTVP